MIKFYSTILFFIFASTSTIGCASNQHKQLAKISPQMDKQDVLEIAGSPTQATYENDHHVWIYRYPVERNMEATKITFQDGFVVDVKPYALRPDKSTVAMDSSDFLEYDKEILKGQKQRTKNFIDLEE